MWGPAAISAVANSPLAMSWKTTWPSTTTSAGATVAVWAIRTRAFPGAIGDSGVLYEFTTGAPPTEAGRWTTMSLLEPEATSTVEVSRSVPDGSVNPT